MKHQPHTPQDASASELSRFASTLLMLLLATATLCACIGPAAAASQGTIYRCVAANGSVSYQDTACAPELRTTAIRRYTSHTIDPALAAHRRAIEQEMDRRNRANSAALRAVSIRQTPKTPSQCDTAKAKRESAVKRAGLKRTFAMMSELDGEVWDVCKGL
jgi:Domain of unknown function (DUF4124)